jgi:hypothetical protein
MHVTNSTAYSGLVQVTNIMLDKKAFVPINPLQPGIIIVSKPRSLSKRVSGAPLG